MDEAVVGQAIDPQDLVVGEVMEVNREDSMHSAVYPCQNFMIAAGILQDFNTLISNAGLENFTSGEPAQFVKLTMSVVQDFRFNYLSNNPTVSYKIYNVPIEISLHEFCTAIKVPYWGSYARINGRPEILWNSIRRSPKVEVCRRKVLKFDSSYSQLFGTSHILLPSVS